LSLISYGMLTLGVVLVGLVLLVIFSLLSMAQEGEKGLEHMELILRQSEGLISPLVQEGTFGNLCRPANPDLRQVGVMETGIFINS
jgi:hypothetical protein